MIGRTIAHYTIQSHIGAGSMGDVYKAIDTKLQRPVAIKFMSPGLMRDSSGTRRFLQEARAASALDHTNICTIYDTGEIEAGRLYLVMAYYEGETLAAKIGRGRLPVEQALAVARQIAAGLTRAHLYGIVHRDIKPANLIVTRFGDVKILDFGLAKLRGQATLTEHGRLMGTIPYMSPEQASGTPVDHRTDIWSLGVVLYEMLTGCRPFDADTTAGTIASILLENPTPITTLRSDLPLEAMEVVERALHKAPDHRIPCHEIVRLLSGDRRPSVLPALEARRTADSPRRSILVMPFVSMDGDVQSEHFGHGLADELTTALSRVSSLRVMARSAAERVKASGREHRDVARELGVEYIVEGAVRRHERMLRVSANLIEASSGSLVWAEQFGGVLEDIFVIQEQLSQRIADLLSVRLSRDHQQRDSAIRLDDITSYDYYLRAKREFVRYEPGGLERALSFIESARSRAGDNVLLLAAAGQIFWQLVNSGSTPDRRYLAKARECAERLLKLDESGAHGPRLLGMVKLLEGNIRETISLLELAESRDPNDTDTLSLLGPCYGYVGRPQSGIEIVNRLLDLDPLTPMYQGIPGYVYLMAGSFEKAIAPFERSYGMDSGNPIIALSYGQCLAMNERAEAAIQIFDDLQRRTPDAFMARIGQLYKCALLRRPDGASALVTSEVEAIADWDLYHSWNLAQCFALIGDADRAIHWLERSIERGMLNYPLLAVLDPFLAPIRHLTVFETLMTNVRREWESATTGLTTRTAVA
jgi:eukaryotic-like serine/threonine-protein kinase